MKPIKVWIARDLSCFQDVYLHFSKPEMFRGAYNNTSEIGAIKLTSYYGLRPGQYQQYEIRRVKEEK